MPPRMHIAYSVRNRTDFEYFVLIVHFLSPRINFFAVPVALGKAYQIILSHTVPKSFMFVEKVILTMIGSTMLYI